MKRTILRISLIVVIFITAILLHNVIFATSTGTDGNNQTETEDSNYLKNIGLKVEEKDYYVGDADGDMQTEATGNISVEDAVITLNVVANYMAGNYETTENDSAYVTYVGLVKDNKIKENKGIKNSDDFYKVFDVNEDGDVTAEDAQQILKYYACKAAGLVKQ